MKRILIILFFFLSANVFAQTKNTGRDKRFEGLDTAFVRILHEWNCAGMAVAVVEKDKLLYTAGFGYADYENRVPITANTLFAAGSCTKSFTCALLGILRSEGKIDFDKPVRNYLPELRFYNDEMNNRIRVRDLMTHSTGLPRHDLSWTLFKTNSQDTLLQRVQYLEPNYGIREKWQYNNFMYLAQGMITEKLTGISYEQNLRERILQPLGMENVNFSIDSMTSKKDFAYGYTTVNGNIYKLNYVNLDVMKPVGGINTSVVEMAKWVMCWINNGKYNGRQVLPPDYVREAMSSQMVIDEGIPSTRNPELYFKNYGLGWISSSYRGHYRVDHGGNIAGFSTSNCFFPTDSIGIVIFCNQENSNLKVIGAVRNLLADRMLKLPYKDWQTFLYASAKSEKQSPKKQATGFEDSPGSAPRALKEYEGVYNNGGYGTFEVQGREDSLFALFPGEEYWLFHHGHDVFELFSLSGSQSLPGGMRMIFGSNELGAINAASMNLEPAIHKLIEFKRGPKTVKITVSDQQRYTGEYDLGGTIIKVFIKDGSIRLSMPNQPLFELLPSGNDKFLLKDYPGIVAGFSTDMAGRVTELVLQQPNGTFKAKRK